MKRTHVSWNSLLGTAILGSTLLYSAHFSFAAKPAMHAMKPVTGVVSGKSLVSQYRCSGCHNSTLAGRPGFSPSIKRTGALHDYTQAEFIKLMHTGMKNDGSHVGKPMPTYAKMPTAQAVTLFKYLWSQK